MTIVLRRLPAVLAVLAAVLAALAGAALATPQAAHAATAPSYALTLSASSGSYTDNDTLTADLTGCPAGDYSEEFLYQGTSSWNVEAINAANGNYYNVDQNSINPYLDFAVSLPPAATTSWPGTIQYPYQDFYGTGATYNTTADVVAALGTGLYTLAAACVTSGQTNAPVLDSSGNPIAASLVVQLDASSWSVPNLSLVSTNAAVTATQQPLSETITLTGTVSTADGSASSGGFDFYAPQFQQSALNGATPVPVGSDGSAQWTGQMPVSPGSLPVAGKVIIEAHFVPASGSSDQASQDYGSVTVILEDVTINYSLTQDPNTTTTADLTVTETVTGTDPRLGGPASTAGTSIGVTVDGKPVSLYGTVALFSGSGVATYQVPNLADGNHAIGIYWFYDNRFQWDSPDDSGIAVTFSPSATQTISIGPYAAAMTLTMGSTSGGIPRLTAVVTGQTSTGEPVTATPGGVVTFTDGSVILGSEPLTFSSGTSLSASVPVFSLPAGANDFTATFTPADPTLFAASTGTLTVNVPTSQTWVQAGLPVISGKAAVGDTLTVEPGTWGPGAVTLAYRWYADGTPIKGATGKTLVLGAAQLGDYIACDVTGSEQGDISSSAYTPAKGPVTKGTLKSPAPKITGTAKAGDTLTAVAGSWTPGTNFRFQWYANGRAIALAATRSLKLAAAEVGKRITVKVTGVKTGYTTVTRTSATTRLVAK